MVEGVRKGMDDKRLDYQTWRQSLGTIRREKISRHIYLKEARLGERDTYMRFHGIRTNYWTFNLRMVDTLD